MVNAKTLIVASFVAMIVSGIAGVFAYYSYLEPFRAVAGIHNPVELLDKVTYLEYTVTDLEGNKYTVKLYNNPAERSGNATLYDSKGNIIAVFEYTYDEKGLSSARLSYPNGTIVDYNGSLIILAEEAFYTGANYTFATGNQTMISLKPFPGSAPLTMHIYLTPLLGINWDYLASIRKSPNAKPSEFMDLRVFESKIKYMGQETRAVILQLTPILVNPPNKWASALYTIALVLDPNTKVPVVPFASIEAGFGTQVYRLDYNLTSIEFSASG